MNNLFIMVCPWQKNTEYTLQQSESGDNIESLTTERFGTCYGSKCPFFDNFLESCMAVKSHITTLQR